MTPAGRTNGYWRPRQDPAARIAEAFPALSPARWTAAALCAQADPEAWYPPHDRPSLDLLDICRRCPVRIPCLEEALESDDYSQHGIWGGTTPEERRRIRASRRQEEVAA